MKLVIVESPTKAKTISKFLGKAYTVESSFGHIRDLPKSKLGIDEEDNFEPHYIIPTKSRKTVNALKKLAAKSDGIILATDEDREGEAIAWHLISALELGKDAEPERIVFHEITENAIKEAIANSRVIDMNLVNAQQGRRILDRLVGYKLSPFLWKKVAKGLSAGRVQSVAVKLIVEREEEIRKFKPQEYWTIEAQCKTPREDIFAAQLTKRDNVQIEKFDINEEKGAQKIANDLKSATSKITSVTQKDTKRNPLPPFTTSTLQQTASSKFGYSAKQTMFLAQRLYESGLITYMRTDSVNLSKESLSAAKKWIADELGEKYSADAPRVFKGKSRLAQEAHEAIRPTDVRKVPEKIQLKEPKEKKLYTLIWQRFVASQMPQAILTSTTVLLNAQGEKSSYDLKANGVIVKFDGYTRIWPQQVSEKLMPQVLEGENVEITEVVPEQHFTEPPPRYSEATLVKALEEFGIGRPSTYAPTISTIQTRNYVIKTAGRLHPTEIGEMVNKMLVKHFPEIVDIEFTAKMEDNLDQVAQGKEVWNKAIKEFYTPFAKRLEEKYESVEKAVMDEKTDEKCEKCGKEMIIKFGRFGKFMACSGFPDCKNAKPLKKNEPKKIGVKCLGCKDGDMVEKRVTRGRARGKIFWGCSRYPECKHASWKDPREEPPIIETELKDEEDSSKEKSSKNKKSPKKEGA